MSEEQESRLRQKVILVVARKDWDSYAWQRVLNRFMKCLNK
jgi:hypothetical protein